MKLEGAYKAIESSPLLHAKIQTPVYCLYDGYAVDLVSYML